MSINASRLETWILMIYDSFINTKFYISFIFHIYSLARLLISDSIIYNDVSSVEIENILEGAWVNHDLTNKSSYPKFFVIENIIDEKNRRLSINFYDREERKDSVGDLKSYTKSEIISVEEISQISSRSYKSYFSLIGIFLVIMIPVSLLVRKLIRKRSLEDE